CSSASVGCCPSDPITVPSSLLVIVPDSKIFLRSINHSINLSRTHAMQLMQLLPSPSLSKRLNASRNSAICSLLSCSIPPSDLAKQKKQLAN
uniref:Uncharacterized protein n=1 Tax=Oryza brachyantha TaxID=4533 RepID=J3N5U3_ORYBR